MNTAFANYVTSTAFHINLSAPQVAALDAVMTYGQQWVHFTEINGRRDFMTPWQALQRRGLVLFYGEDQGNTWLGPAGGGWKEPAWRVTEAGKLIHSLLIEAGLVQTNDAKVAV